MSVRLGGLPEQLAAIAIAAECYLKVEFDIAAIICFWAKTNTTKRCSEHL